MEENKESNQKQPIVSAYGAVLGEKAGYKEESTSESGENKPIQSAYQSPQSAYGAETANRGTSQSTYSTASPKQKQTYGLYTHTSPVDNDPFADSPFTNPDYVAQQAAKERMTREQYADHMKKQRKHSRILRKLITLVIVLIILLVVAPAAISQIEKMTCDRPLKKMESMVNDRQTSSKSVMKAMAPYFLYTMYQDSYEICNNNVEYRSELQAHESDFNDYMETLYSEMFTSGDETFAYKVNSKTELSKEELKSIQKTYGSVAELVPSIQSLMKAVYAKTELSDEEISQLSDSIGKMGTKMEKMKVFAGYKLNVTTKLNEEEQSTLDIVVILANGHWMIDYISTAALATDKSYNIEEMYQTVGGTNVSQLQFTLNALTQQVSASDKDFEEILEDVLQSVTSQYSFQ
jgi:hypothetical protein